MFERATGCVQERERELEEEGEITNFQQLQIVWCTLAGRNKFVNFKIVSHRRGRGNARESEREKEGKRERKKRQKQLKRY